MVKPQDYRVILNRVSKEFVSKPREGALRATPKDVGLLCPHLSKAQVNSLWDDWRETMRKHPDAKPHHFIRYPDVYVPLPPLRANKPGLYARFDPRYPDGLVRVLSFLGWKADSFKFYPEALSFAQANWPDALITEDIGSVCHFSLQAIAPSDQQRGRLSVVAGVDAVLRRTQRDLLEDGRRFPTDALDNATIFLTTDKMISDEAVGASNRFWFNTACARCGYGLRYAGCDNCGLVFYEPNWRNGIYYPVTPRLYEHFTNSGHHFAQNIYDGWNREQLLWGEGTLQLSGPPGITISF